MTSSRAGRVRRLVERLAFAGVAATDSASSLPGRIQVTEAVYERLRSAYDFEARGEIEIKGKGRLRTYLLNGRRSPDSTSTPVARP